MSRTLPWLLLCSATAWPQQSFRPEIPKAWDEDALRTMELPLATPDASPVHISAERYYAIPAMTVYKTYPLAMPGKTAEEYRAWLMNREPEIVRFDSESLRTKEDWISAGRSVFEWAVRVVPEPPARLQPTLRFVIRSKGRIEYGSGNCSGCHERHLENAVIIPGAQLNLEQDWRDRPPRSAVQGQVDSDFATPWLTPDPNRLPPDTPVDTLIRLFTRVPSLVPRFNSSPWAPAAMPDLIGVRERRYLDRTGLVQHRGIGDLMRYAALNLGVGNVALSSSYAGYVPNDHVGRPRTLSRFSDEQLYALALYIYSLEPPKNPNPMDAAAVQGQKVFQREGCAGCHAPPLYTNNKLTPAPGFRIPPEHKDKYEILPVTVGTDPWLAMKTRRGTGYYKVPSLRGVWYRGPFEHNGSVLRLEDWFDPSRLRDDYVPTGWLGPNPTRAVKGHEFGLKLNPREKQNLIAFLKTL